MLYRHVYDLTEIEFVRRDEFRILYRGGKISRIRLDNPLLTFKYVKSEMKIGEICISEADFNRYLRSGIFVLVNEKCS